MTTSEDARTTANLPAAREGASGGQVPAQRANADTQETAPITGRVAAPPGNQEQLEAEIARTRQQLGETVQELFARTDVKSIARAKAAEMTGKVRSKTVQARTKATARAGQMRSQVAGRTTAARQRAITAGGAGRDQLRTRASSVATPVWSATPEPVRRAVTKGASSAGERRTPLALAAAALVFGYLGFKLRSGRSPGAV